MAYTMTMCPLPTLHINTIPIHLPVASCQLLSSIHSVRISFVHQFNIGARFTTLLIAVLFSLLVHCALFLAYSLFLSIFSLFLSLALSISLYIPNRFSNRYNGTRANINSFFARNEDSPCTRLYFFSTTSSSSFSFTTTAPFPLRPHCKLHVSYSPFRMRRIVGALWARNTETPNTLNIYFYFVAPLLL